MTKLECPEETTRILRSRKEIDESTKTAMTKKQYTNQEELSRAKYAGCSQVVGCCDKPDVESSENSMVSTEGARCSQESTWLLLCSASLTEWGRGLS